VFIAIAFSVSGWKFAATLSTILLVIGISVLSWRAVFSRRHWMIVACEKCFYFRLFRPFGSSRWRPREPSVIAVEEAEISSIALQALDVLIKGPKPIVVESLILHLKSEADITATSELERLSRVSSLIPDKLWYVRKKSGSLLIRWRGYRPAATKFLSEIALRNPLLPVASEARSELDLTGLGRKSAREQQRLLRTARQLGLGAKCVSLLMNKPFYMSMTEAVRYLSGIETHDEDYPPTPPATTGTT
jgi:hypothetical protein